MNHVSSILAIVDPTADQHTGVQKAAVLASAFGARLQLFICDTPLARETRMVRGLARDPGHPLTTNLRPLLEALARPLREQGLQVTTDSAFHEQLHTGLLERIDSLRPNLVVKDTHHHSLVSRAFLTNTDWHLIRDCPGTLLLTKNHAWASPPKILAAIDPEHVNDKPALLDHHILEWAAEFAQHTSGTLHVAHAYIPLVIANAATAGASPVGSLVSVDMLADEEHSRRMRIANLTSAYGISADHVHLALGTATDVLPRTAQEQQADMVVMGAVSRRGLQRVFIGNTAERVLEALPCDALVIKPPGFQHAVSV